jgi:hypothetical protein
LPLEDSKTPKEARISVGKVQINLNDNFLLLLASLVEYHLQDTLSLLSLINASQIKVSPNKPKNKQKL